MREVKGDDWYGDAPSAHGRMVYAAQQAAVVLASRDRLMR